jgi:hypothetical protein
MTYEELVTIHNKLRAQYGYHLDDCFIISAYSYDDRDNLLCIKNMASIVFDYDASGYEIRHLS